MSSDPMALLFPGFDPQRWIAAMARALQGPEQAMRVDREMLGLEGGSRERAVDFIAQMVRTMGVDATPIFAGVLRFHPAPTARVAAAAYLVDQGREATVLEVLESLRPPVLTMTLLDGLLDPLGTRPATPELIERLVQYASGFQDSEHYTTLDLGDFTGRDVKRQVRRALADSVIRRDAPDAVDWPRA